MMPSPLLYTTIVQQCKISYYHQTVNQLTDTAVDSIGPVGIVITLYDCAEIAIREYVTVITCVFHVCHKHREACISSAVVTDRCLRAGHICTNQWTPSVPHPNIVAVIQHCFGSIREAESGVTGKMKFGIVHSPSHTVWKVWHHWAVIS